ncbi:DUF1661 domain-containing protein [Porphyromonas gingivalis]|uniref:DUF1661 domain-containing protein n=1 Tax=Porphyromonas gingivalis TaxID=837 RepID=UPI000717AD50|nr:DUF1661 domain-containing protein [Porphyromonas gingivalis]
MFWFGKQKNLRARTKKFSLHIFRKHAPQSEDFRCVFLRQQVIDRSIEAMAKPYDFHIVWELSYNHVFTIHPRHIILELPPVYPDTALVPFFIMYFSFFGHMISVEYIFH